MKSKLGKGIILVFVANLVSLLFNMLTNLIVPKSLSVESYATIKTYQLYMSYIGIIHLGYNDGMYLKYGGKDLKDIGKDELSEGISVIRIYMFFMMCMGIVVSMVSGNFMLLIVSIAMFPTNLVSYFQFLYQACGEFEIYGKVLNYVSIGTFLINMLLIYLVQTDNYIWYLTSYVLLNCVIWLYIEKRFISINGSKVIISYFSIQKLINGMKKGIFLTLGNFSSILMTTMDRLFVKYLIGTVAFAQYSFSVSMENFLNMAITPITLTLYNYFCNYDTSESNKNIRERVIVFASLIIAAAYPVKFILEIYLTNYYDSVSVLFLLFASQMFYVVVKGIYVNLYKARKNQKQYLLDLVILLIFGFIANIVGYYALGNKESFAIATLFSAIFWLILCQFKFKDFTIYNYLYMVVQLLVFIFTGIYLNSLIGFITYSVFTCVSILVFMRPVLVWVTAYIKKFIRGGFL